MRKIWRINKDELSLWQKIIVKILYNIVPIIVILLFLIPLVVSLIFKLSGGKVK